MEDVMDKQSWKCVLLACLWWEVCVGLDLEKGTAFFVTIVLMGGLAMIGAGCRMIVDHFRHASGLALWADHPFVVVTTLVGVALLVTTAAMFAAPAFMALVLYGAPPAVPLLFGWHMSMPVATGRTDARFGDAKTFRSAGYSDER
jgi:hypothetical protein